MQSDLIRLALLYTMGGVWADLKIAPLKPFLSELVDSEKPFLVEHFPTSFRMEPDNFLVNMVMGAPAGDPFILALLQEAVEGVEARREGGVYGLTGGHMILRVANRWPKEEWPDHFRILRYGDFWDVLVSRGELSYNRPNSHWSLRQEVEPLYVEQDEQGDDLDDCHPFRYPAEISDLASTLAESQYALSAVRAHLATAHAAEASLRHHLSTVEHSLADTEALADGLRTEITAYKSSRTYRLASRYGKVRHVLKRARRR